MSTNACAECKFENDLTRVFCQNCGTRLPPPEGPATFAPAGTPAVVASPGVGKSRRGGRGALRAIVGQLGFLLLTAASLAAVIQMFRVPDGIPEPVDPDEKAALLLSSEVGQAAAAPYLRLVEITPAAANNFLASHVVPVGTSQSRAFVVSGDGTFRFYLQRIVLGLPVYVYLTEKPVTGPSGLATETVGGGVGRLPFDPRLVPLLEGIIQPVYAVIADALVPFSKANGMAVTPKSAKVSWPGANAAKARPATP